MGPSRQSYATYLQGIDLASANYISGTEYYIHVFINTIGRDVYTALFKEVFQIFSDVSGEPVRWYYIHTSIRIQAVIADIDGI